MSENKEPKMIEIGAFWKRTSQKGKRYLNGSIDPASIPESFGEKIKVVMFPNGAKEKDSQPDFYLYLSNQPAQTTATKQPASSKTTKVAKAEKQEVEEEKEDVKEEDEGLL